MSPGLPQHVNETRQEILQRFHRRIQQGSRTKLSKQELEMLVDCLVQDLIRLHRQGQDSRQAIARRCQQEVALLEEGYTQNSVNSVYLPRYTAGVRRAIEDGRLPLTEQNSYAKPWMKRDGSESGVTQQHYALDYLTYPLEVQRALRAVTTMKANQRQDNLQPVDLDRYMETVETLLVAEDVIDWVIAIAALTGRRHTEVVSLGGFDLTSGGEFNHLTQQAHPYLLRFEGHQKSDKPAFDILTLLPAKDVLLAIEQLRSSPKIVQLQGADCDDMGVRALNTQVNARCREVFEKTGLIPVPEGFETISIHRLRALYVTIATHYFCPPTQAEYRFVQHFLGHVLIDEEAMPTTQATAHYFQFYLVRNGKPLQAKGVKLAANGVVPLPSEHQAKREGSAIQDLSQPAVARPGQPAEGALTAADSTTTTTTSSADLEEDAMNNQLLNMLQEQLREQAATIRTLSEALARGNAAGGELVQPDPQLMAEVNRWRSRYLAAAEKLRQLEALAHSGNPFEAAQKFIEFDFSLDAEEDSDYADETTVQTRESATSTQANAEPLAQSTATAQGNGRTGRKSVSRQTQRTPYRRGKRIIQLTQEWNEQYPQRAIMLTKSIFSNQFGISSTALNTFWNDFGSTIDELNQPLGDERPRAFNRNKIDDFVDYVKPKLEAEDLYD